MQNYLNSLTIILIEPSSSQRKIVINQFGDLGISEFEAVETGREALDLIDAKQPDLVISAMFLEDMTGKDVVLEMRENSITADTPFVLISTETSFSRLNPIKQSGASAILPKPFKLNDLKRAILMIMDWENPDRIELENRDAKNLEVLVVDDSQFARRMICRTLNKMGLESITEANDGRTALPLIENKHFDLIVTDYNMPDMDGHELLMYIRQESQQRSVPVLMITTEGNESKLAAIIHDGVSAIIDKPFEVSEVKKLIETVLSGT